MIEITVENSFKYSYYLNDFHSAYQPKQFLESLFHDMSVQTKQCKKLLNQYPKCSFSYLLINYFI